MPYDLLIFMDQSAEPITTPNPSRAGHAAGYQDLIGRPLAQGGTVPMAVDVIDILGQHLLQVTLIHDEYPIQTLATHTANPSLTDRVRPRSLDRAPHDVDADRREHRIERGRELRVAVTDQKPQTVHATIKLHQQIPDLLNHRLRSRMSGHPCNMDTTTVVFNKEQHVQPAQQHSVDVEEVDRQDALSLGSEELLPCRSCSARCRVQACTLEDRRCRGCVPQPDEFTVASPVTPSWVVPGHLQHQPADRCRDRRAPWSASIGPPTSH